MGYNQAVPFYSVFDATKCPLRHDRLGFFLFATEIELLRVISQQVHANFLNTLVTDSDLYHRTSPVGFAFLLCPTFRHVELFHL